MKKTDTPSQAIFITGIDTDAGKTYATASYARMLEEQGLGVITQKFIQTGCIGTSEDKWTLPRYLAIDQLTIAPMIENHRSGLLWRLFMGAPEVQEGLKKLGITSTATTNNNE